MTLTIMTTYQDQAGQSHDLALIKKAPGQVGALDWTAHPLKMPKNQFAAITTDLVLPILKNTAKLPSELAGLNPQKLTPIVAAIDEQLRIAKTKYEILLYRAEIKDLTKIVALEAANVPYSGFFWWWHWMWGNYKTKETIDTEGSVYRIQWLHQVDGFEKDRLESISTQIENGLKPLLKDIKDLGADFQKNTLLNEKALQLIAVFKAIFPNQPLPVKDISDQLLLTQIKA